MTKAGDTLRPAAAARESAGRWLEIRFLGLERSVLIPDRFDLRQGLLDLVPDWPCETRRLNRPEDRRNEVLVAVQPQGGRGDRFDLASIYTDAPLCGLGLAGALCGIVADMHTAHAEAHPGTLTLHCGAVLFHDFLVALAGPHRAGKSTLIARLSAEPDLSVFCDDVLPLDSEGRGIALGIAPRLRLPLPPTASDAFHRHVATHLGPADDRYGYVCAPTVARHGRRAPLGALVVLERRESSPARLHRLDPDSAIQQILARNIGDLGTADHAFGLVRDTARRARCLTLVYSDLEEAVALLRQAFTGDRAAEIAPPLAPAPAVPETAAAPVDPDRPWHRAGDVAIRRVGASAFLWRPGDTTLWRMNPVAQMVWTALDLPGSARDVAEAIADHFPDTPAAQIRDDVGALIAILVERDLVRDAASPPTAATP
jgi:hypothetical protein